MPSKTLIITLKLEKKLIPTSEYKFGIPVIRSSAVFNDWFASAIKQVINSPRYFLWTKVQCLSNILNSLHSIFLSTGYHQIKKGRKKYMNVYFLFIQVTEF